MQVLLTTDSGPQADTTFRYPVVDFRRITFGREGTPDLHGRLSDANDRSVSREHFVLLIGPGLCSLMPAESARSPTYLDGEQVTDPVPIAPRQKISAGRNVFVFGVDGELPAAIPSPLDLPEVEIVTWVFEPGGTEVKIVRLPGGGLAVLKGVSWGGHPEGERLRARFLHEARILRMLQHQHIVALLDCVERGDETWILMEHIEGRTLDEAGMLDGPLPVAMMARLGCHIASALDFAHSHGVIHRDVKPQNVLIEDESGEARLIDFGIAVLKGDPRITRTGMPSPLTATFAAPEQLEGGTVVPATDVYGLGASLFWALTYDQKNKSQEWHRHGDPVRDAERVTPARSLAQVAPQLPTAFSNTIDRCLDDDPPKRPSARQLIDLLAPHC